MGFETALPIWSCVNQTLRTGNCLEPSGGSGYRGIGPGLGLDGIEEVTCVDEDIGFLSDYYIDR